MERGVEARRGEGRIGVAVLQIAALERVAERDDRDSNRHGDEGARQPRPGQR